MILIPDWNSWFRLCCCCCPGATGGASHPQRHSDPTHEEEVAALFQQISITFLVFKYKLRWGYRFSKCSFQTLCVYLGESLVASLSRREFSEELNKLELSAVLHANNILLRWTPGFGLTHKVRPKREFSGKTGHSVDQVQIFMIEPLAVVANVHQCSWLRSS